jgi:hypothetical protein
MDKLNHYRDLIKKILTEYSDSHPSKVQIDPSPSPSPTRRGEQDSGSPFPSREGG